VFVDLRTWDQPGYAQAKTADVIALMSPELEKARAAGVTALVECSTVGVGRRADILKAVSEAAGFPLVAPTGIYREPWVPDWAHAASEDELYEWMRGELEGQIEASGVQAGFIVERGRRWLTACGSRFCALPRVFCRDRRAVAATIRGVSCATNSALSRRRLLDRAIIWIHAMVEPDIELNLEMARRGAWIEYDNIGQEGTDASLLHRIQRMLDAGLGDQVLLSHDRGWYDPAQPGGGTPKPFTYLGEQFLPRLRAAGVNEATLRKMTCENPFGPAC
jgi:phosphotriesterase-related protein